MYRKYPALGMIALILVIFFCSVGVLTFAGDGKGKRPPKPPPEPGPLLYTSGFWHSELYNADPETGTIQRLTNFDVAQPRWSPDDFQITFMSTIWGQGLYTMNLDGTALTKVVDVNVFDVVSGTHGLDWSPVPTPAGEKIIFCDLDPMAGNYDLFAVNPDGTELVNLTATPSTDESWPSFAPTGDRLVFFRNNKLIVADLGLVYGSLEIIGQKDIKTGTPLDGFWMWYPRWMRTQDSILVSADTSGEGGDLWRIDLDNLQNPVQLTSYAEDGPVWEAEVDPTDTYIYHRRWSKNNYYIYRMNADGTNPVKVANDKRGMYRPAYRHEP